MLFVHCISSIISLINAGLLLQFVNPLCKSPIIIAELITDQSNSAVYIAPTVHLKHFM